MLFNGEMWIFFIEKKKEVEKKR